MSQVETAAHMSIKLIRPYILDVTKSHLAVVVLVFYCSYVPLAWQVLPGLD